MRAWSRLPRWEEQQWWMPSRGAGVGVVSLSFLANPLHRGDLGVTNQVGFGEQFWASSYHLFIIFFLNTCIKDVLMAGTEDPAGKTGPALQSSVSLWSGSTRASVPSCRLPPRLGRGAPSLPTTIKLLPASEIPRRICWNTPPHGAWACALT